MAASESVSLEAPPSKANKAVTVVAADESLNPNKVSLPKWCKISVLLLLMVQNIHA